MIKQIQKIVLTAFLVMGVASASFAQNRVTIRDLNTYEGGLTDELNIPNHPLAGDTVALTALIVSYPQNSGLASYNQDGNSIGRIHVFVIDTTAASQNRDGMGMQIVESNTSLMEPLTRGAMVDITGRLTFFGETAQFDVISITEITDNFLGADDELLPRYAALLEPWEIDLTELNTFGADGIVPVLSNYTKYVGQYVKITNAVVGNIAEGPRVDWSVSTPGAKLYAYDTSLRYRNDRPIYKSGYNWRRSEADGGKGNFVPPAPGSVINLSGFVVFNGDDPNGERSADWENDFNINPWDDGTVWLNDARQDPADWPNDVEVVGSPPLISDLGLTPDLATYPTADPITVAATVAGPEAGITVDSVKFYWIVKGDTSSTLMTAGANDSYSFEIPGGTFTNYTAVSYYVEAYGSNDIDTRFPFGGANSFFVADGAINAIAIVQATADGDLGDSPLAGSGVLPMDITATVTSDLGDGVLVIQDADSAFSGIFINPSFGDVDTLVKGDVINITAAEVLEDDEDYSYLDNLTYTGVSEGADWSALIPQLSTADLKALPNDGGEAYEGMVISFPNVSVVDKGRFGEFSIASAGETDGIIINEDTRSSIIGETAYRTEGVVGNAGFDIFPNAVVKEDAVFASVTGIMTFTFGQEKVIPRGLADLVADDWSHPTPLFGFTAPADSAEIVVDQDLQISWETTTDIDGDDVEYEFVLFNAADTTEIISFSTMEGEPNQALLPALAVNDLLDSLGVADGQSITALWSVRVFDSSADSPDTLLASTGYDDRADAWTPFWYTVTLTNSDAVNVEDDVQPLAFKLNQNYPNPFNPSTEISFQIAETGMVRLSVFDLLGRQVATLVNETRQAGTYSVNFDASGLASGMYIYRLDAAGNVFTKKMMLLK